MGGLDIGLSPRAVEDTELSPRHDSCTAFVDDRLVSGVANVDAKSGTGVEIACSSCAR